MNFSLYFLDNSNEVALEFSSPNMGDIIALIKALCYSNSGVGVIENQMLGLLQEHGADCNAVDAVLSGVSHDFIKNKINDNKKIEYIETLVNCITCNAGVDERLIVLNLLKGFVNNSILYNYLKNNDDQTTDIHEWLICPVVGPDSYTKEFGSIVGALCSEYWPTIVDGTTKFIRTGGMGGQHIPFDPISFKIDGEIKSVTYYLEQEMSGPILPDFLNIYTIAHNLRAGAVEFETPPLAPVRLYDVGRDESIYLPGAAIYNIALKDSYESAKNDVLNLMQFMGFGSAARVLSVPQSSRLLNLVAATEIVKAGVLDNLFKNPEIRKQILDIKPEGQEFLDTWETISMVADIATFSTEQLFASLDDTGKKVMKVLEDSNNAHIKNIEEGTKALRAIVEAAELIEALKKAYPVLNNYSKFSDLAALPNAKKLLNSNLSDIINALGNTKQLELFDDFLLNNGSLIDNFADNALLVKAWEALFGHPTLRKNASNLEYLGNKRSAGIKLDIEEALGGHSIARHGHQLSLSEMEQRVLGTHPTFGQSRSALRFDNASLHKNVVDQAFNTRKADIKAHFESGQTTNFDVDYDYGNQIGAGYTNVGTLGNPIAVAVTSTKVKLVFKADPNNPTGFKLLTAYPSYP